MPKKILLCTEEYPPDVGGVATYLEALCGETGSENLLAVVMRDKQTSPVHHVHDLVTTKEYVFLPSWLQLLRPLQQEIREFGPEVLVAGQVLRAGFVLALLARRHKLPFVIFAHGMDVLVPQKYFFKKILARWAYRRADLIIANSNYTAKLVRDFAGAHTPVAIVHPSLPAVTQQQYAGEGLRERFAVSGKKIILFVGRLVQRKGVDTVLHALAQVIVAVPDAVLVVVGDGPQRVPWQRLARELGVAPFVRFAGQVTPAEKAEWYRQASVFVTVQRPPTPADVEGFGIVFLEAASNGLPVVGGANGGVLDAVENGTTGFLVDAGDANIITDRIIGLLKNTALAKQMGEKGKARAAKEFSRVGQQKKFFDLLEGVALSKKPKDPVPKTRGQ